MTGARPDTWMPTYWGDLLRDVGHLSTQEFGAYVFLIGHYWTTGGPLQDDENSLRRVCRMTSREWDVSRETLAGFFYTFNDLWVHKRIEEEIDKAAKVYRAKCDRTKAAREEKKRRHNGLTDDVTESVTEAVTAPVTGTQPQPQPQPQSPKGEKEESPPIGAGVRTAVPRDFQPDAECEQFAALKCIQRLDLEVEIEQFVNHYRGTGELVADWQAYFRKWLGKRGQFASKNGHNPRQTNAPPSFAKAAMAVLKRAEGGK